MENNIDKYKLSNMRKILIWLENYEFGEPIMDSIRFARYDAMDQFASNIVACNDKDFSDEQDFLFTLSMNPTTENQLKMYLLKQKKLILKHISTRGHYMGSHLYQLYLQFLFCELNDEEKKIFLENYIEMVKDLRGENIANQKNNRLEKTLCINSRKV
ncbi:MAG: hypothetical protein E7166_00900 [Firmicutes bacterium]|nr:hypothetical protein [Bacillota bacterium]